MNLKERIKVYLWMLTRGNRFRYQYWKLRKARAQLNFFNSLDTLDFILGHRPSVSRFGDGEFQIMISYLNEIEGRDIIRVDTFQNYNTRLGKRLYEIFTSTTDDKFINCVPFALKDAGVFGGHPEYFFMREFLLNYDVLLKKLGGKPYYDTCFTRFYMDRRDIKDYPAYVRDLKRIWQGRDVLMIEGEKSRCGVGNDLFEGAKSLQRVLCPVKNAFDSYDEILSVGKELGKDKLVLIALGQTATVLAYDLAQEGIQAIDLGHLDVEYEWYRSGVKEKVPIEGKYVNEVAEGRNVSEEVRDQEIYLSQIIARVGI